MASSVAPAAAADVANPIRRLCDVKRPADFGAYSRRTPFSQAMVPKAPEALINRGWSGRQCRVCRRYRRIARTGHVEPPTAGRTMVAPR